jgi:class 3 adenylate cyclase
MKIKVRLLLNTVSIALILLAVVLFFVYLFYSQDLKDQREQVHRETAKFMLSLVDERIAAIRAAGGAEQSPEAAKLLAEIVAAVAGYFDPEDTVNVLVYRTGSGEVLYTSSGRESSLPEDLEQAFLTEEPEGVLTLSDRFGYAVRYPDPPLTFFIYSLNRELYYYRNLLLYLLAGFVALFILFMFLSQRKMLGRLSGFLDHMSASFSDVIQGKRNVPDRIDEVYGEEFGEFPHWYNSMLDRVASVLKQFEERLRSLFKQRDSLKKMIFLYKKYLPDEALVRINEKDVDEVVSRRQSVTSMSIELVNFIQPLGELYPQVITDELNELHIFLKEEVVRGSGVINFSDGYHINIVYGVPQPDERSFMNACSGAKKILEWIGMRNSSGKSLSGIKWNVKLGLNHGNAVTGIVGFNYIVIGEVIERSWKMVELGKKFNVALVTDSIDQLAHDPEMKYRKLDIVSMGRSSTVTIYEIFLKSHDMIDQIIRLYNHGLEMYYDEKYEMAVLEFKKVISILENDNPSKIFLSRCERAIKGKR